MPPISHKDRKSETPVFLMALGMMLLVLLLLIIPAIPSQGSSASAPTFPGMMPRLGCNNLKTNDVFKVDLACGTGSITAILASVEAPPVSIGSWTTSLGADWFILQGLTSLGGSDHLHLSFGIPDLPWLVGTPFVLQAAVLDPTAPDVMWSTPTFVRVSQGSPNGMKNLLVVRQTTTSPGMTNAAAQASALVAVLAGNGHAVAMVDNLIPSDLRNYDVVLDLRFTATPPPMETAALAEFMTQGGGVFLLAGPYSGSSAGQLRSTWVSNFLNVTLGMGVYVGSGGNLSGSATETVSSMADASYRNTPLSITGINFDVTNEGGNFGPPQSMTQGTPWIVGLTNLGYQTYGALFTSADYAAFHGQGNLAVLFSGGAGAIDPTSSNPNVQAVFENLVHWLDR